MMMLPPRDEDITIATGDLPDSMVTLLDEASYKPVRRFLQLDGWHNADDNMAGVMPPDEDGDHITVNKRHDLRASPEQLVVRVQIIEGADPEEALRLLRKLTAALEARVDES